MQHFYQNIQGWFNFENIYRYMANTIKDNDHYVEVGAWKGRSTAFMAVEIANSGKNIRFDVVDTWLGSEEHALTGSHQDTLAIQGSLYETFIQNMKPVEKYYNPIRMPSLEASRLYKNDSLDFVLLDAAHDHFNVSIDILSWLPKVKPGGILAGDDFHTDWPGVIRAVNELLPGYRVEDRTWIYRKP